MNQYRSDWQLDTLQRARAAHRMLLRASAIDALERQRRVEARLRRPAGPPGAAACSLCLAFERGEIRELRHHCARSGRMVTRIADVARNSPVVTRMRSRPDNLARQVVASGLVASGSNTRRVSVLDASDALEVCNCSPSLCERPRS